jgi:hypothetical protein
MFLVFNADEVGNRCAYVVENVRASINSKSYFYGDYLCVLEDRISVLSVNGAFEMERILGVFTSKALALEFAKQFVEYKELTIANMKVGCVGRINSPGHPYDNKVFMKMSNGIVFLVGDKAGQYIHNDIDLVKLSVELSTISIVN